MGAERHHARRTAGVAAAIAGALFAAACGGPPAPEREFADLAEAIEAGAVAEGGLPGFLPGSAREIRERRSNVSNEVWVRFALDPADRAGIEQACTEIPSLETVHPRLSTTDHIPWWDKGLRLASAQGQGAYRMYRCHRGDPGVRKPWAFLAIDEPRGVGWYWELRH